MTPEEIEEIRERWDQYDSGYHGHLKQAASDVSVLLTALEEAEARVERYREALKRVRDCHELDASGRHSADLTVQKVHEISSRALEREER